MLTKARSFSVFFLSVQFMQLWHLGGGWISKPKRRWVQSFSLALGGRLQRTIQHNTQKAMQGVGKSSKSQLPHLCQSRIHLSEPNWKPRSGDLLFTFFLFWRVSFLHCYTFFVQTSHIWQYTVVINQDYMRELSHFSESFSGLYCVVLYNHSLRS